MGFMPFWSLLTSSFDDSLKGLGDLVKKLIIDARRHLDGASDHARQNAAQMTERAGSINPPNGIGFTSLFSRQKHSQGIEVIVYHFGTGSLASR